MNSGLSPVALGSENDFFWGASTKVVPWSWCGKLRRAGGLRLWFFQLLSGCMGILSVFHMRTMPSHRPSSSNDLDLDCSCNAETNYHSSLLVGGICDLSFSYPKLSVSQDLRRLNPTSGVHHKTEWASGWRAGMPLVVGWSLAVFFFPRPSLEVTVYRTMVGNDASICFYNPYKNRIYIILHLCFWPPQK